MVVLRFRMGQWQHRKASASRSVAELANGEPNTTQQPENTVVPETSEEQWVEVDPVEAMIEGVKSRGVRFFFLCSNRLVGLKSLYLDRGVS